MFVHRAPETLIGKPHGNGHGVALVQLNAGLPSTDRWRPGVKVASVPQLPKGIVIATFHGRKYMSIPHQSHAAIYLSHGVGHHRGKEVEGIWVIDQWKGHPASKRFLPFVGATGSIDTADSYYVVETN